ncbi:TPA: hypothetical protein ACGVCM_001384 [Streptococcus agalactiae]|uniref:hypothetical protein n=1 Tax=Streptococcus TaxID=1301 RepID=UPI0002BBB176|nr:MULTISPECIES: hypothetical protein [Streptococcus]QBX27792.1 hypothetical protein Javan42_0044 [Streptococcus phage Javan42]EPU85074.1 hypothetical protein SAG0317_02995 [Streptococcus agalactiae GB00219]EPV23774.1 hypothetical protein SAG0335_05595 [Streptococcus agalactiae GB00651]EPV98065.1 hypothetical protein SAG0039_06050 [Streptococcus agalactiae FSL S3-014]EPW02642.1 hypothetical protein SAG0043_07090 [Streptococcus agalactiae FSL S3-137]
MAKFKATSNVVFVVDGKETAFDENVEYDMKVKTAEELNAKGQLTHPELSPFFERVDKEEKAAKADK